MTGAVPLLAIFHDCLVIIRLHYHEACAGGLMPATDQLHAVPFFVSTGELSLSDMNQLFLDGIRDLEQHFSSFAFRVRMRSTFPIGECTENQLFVLASGVSGCRGTLEFVGDHFLISNNPTIVTRTENIEIARLHIQLGTVI